MADKGSLTVAEAGRLGGKKVAEQYGSEHMSKIGKQGGKMSPTKFAAGDERTASIAAKGGSASGGNFANNKERAAEAGRKGGQARAAKSKQLEAEKSNTGTEK